MTKVPHLVNEMGGLLINVWANLLPLSYLLGCELGLRPHLHGIRAESVSLDVGAPTIRIVHALDAKHWAWA